jgi:D-alanyl-D-alanine carboxypeptidase
MRGLLYIWLMVLLVLSTALSAGAQAQSVKKPEGRYASIIVDADNLDVIHARQIDEIRYPASLTKVMTLYLTFDALNAGTLKLDSQLKVSRTAASVSPTKLDLRTGQTISVDNLIKAVAVRSANDAAVVLAEHLSGSEDAFAFQMTAKARSLGMSKTTFKTANGLPHPEQVTTARDMAKLANAILVNHRRHYHYFGIESFRYNGRTYRNTNGLLHDREDVDGFKTGFTRASGYNLIVSAQRDGRRLIAVVLGGASGSSRNSHMSDLVERGFDVMGVKPQVIMVAQTPENVKPAPKKTLQIIRLRGPKTISNNVIKASTQTTIVDPWSVQLGLFADAQAAQAHLNSVTLLPELSKAKPEVQKRGTQYVARMRHLSAQSARDACKALEKSRYGCLVIAPSS